MNNLNKKSACAPERVIAGAIFTLLALMELLMMVTDFTAWSLLLFFGYGICAASLFIGVRQPIILGGIGLVVLVHLILFFLGFGNDMYSNYEYYYSYYSGSRHEYVFSLLNLLPSLARIAAWVALALFAVTQLMGVSRESMRRVWYLPALILVLSDLLGLLAILVSGGDWMGGEAFMVELILSGPLFIAFIFTGLWLAEREPEGYFPIASHIVLTIITLGLWFVTWVWHVTAHLNQVKNAERRRPTGSLLLCLFLPLYAFYWNYATAQRIDRLAKEKGVESKLDVLCLVLGLLIPFLPSIIMQEKLNRIDLVQKGALLPDELPAAPAASASAPVPASAPTVPAAPAYTPVYSDALPDL